MTATLVACSILLAAEPDPQQLVAEAESATIEYWRWTGKDEVSYWDVVFNKAEIRSVARLLKNARPYSRDGLVMFVTAYPGSLLTGNTEYSLSVGEQKNAANPMLFILRPKDAPRTRLMYRLTGEDSGKFSDLFRKALVEKTKDIKPTRVEQHK